MYLVEPGFKFGVQSIVSIEQHAHQALRFAELIYKMDGCQRDGALYG